MYFTSPGDGLRQKVPNAKRILLHMASWQRQRVGLAGQGREHDLCKGVAYAHPVGVLPFRVDIEDDGDALLVQELQELALAHDWLAAVVLPDHQAVVGHGRAVLVVPVPEEVRRVVAQAEDLVEAESLGAAGREDDIQADRHLSAAVVGRHAAHGHRLAPRADTGVGEGCHLVVVLAAGARDHGDVVRQVLKEQAEVGRARQRLDVVAEDHVPAPLEAWWASRERQPGERDAERQGGQGHDQRGVPHEEQIETIQCTFVSFGGRSQHKCVQTAHQTRTIGQRRLATSVDSLIIFTFLR